MLGIAVSNARHLHKIGTGNEKNPMDLLQLYIKDVRDKRYSFTKDFTLHAL